MQTELKEQDIIERIVIAKERAKITSRYDVPKKADSCLKVGYLDQANSILIKYGFQPLNKGLWN